MVFLQLNTGKTNIQSDLPNKAKGEHFMGKAGKPRTSKGRSENNETSECSLFSCSSV